MIALTGSVGLFAKTYTWQGGARGGAGTDQTNLFKAGNWSPSGFNPENSDLIFTNANASSSSVLDVKDSTTLNSITFGEGALSFTLTNSSSLLTLNGGTNITDNSTNLQTLAVRIALAGNSVWNTGKGAQLLVSGNISQVGSTPIGITKIGAGTLTLAGSNSFRGVTTINAGTLVIGTNNSIAGNVMVSGGVFNIGAFSDTVGAVTLGSGSITGTTGVLTGSGYNVTNGLISAILGGSGALAKGGTGTVTLSGANTYTGTSTVSAGTLALSGGDNRLNVAGSVALSNGATLTLGGFNQTLAGLTGSGSVTNSAGTLTLNAGSGTVTYGGSITGGGNLLKSGAFAQMLSGTSAFSGTTIVTGGSLSLGTSGRLTQTASVTVTNGTTLLLGSSQANSINTNATLNLGGGQLSMGGAGIGNHRAASQTFASLTLTANSSIDFAALSGTSSFYFSNISGLSTYTLSIFNWNGTNLYGQSSATGGANQYTRLYASTDGSFASALGNIRFYSGSTTSSTFMGEGSFSSPSSGGFTQIVPVPEPSVVIAAVMLLGFLVHYQIRRDFQKSYLLSALQGDLIARRRGYPSSGSRCTVTSSSGNSEVSSLSFTSWEIR